MFSYYTQVWPPKSIERNSKFLSMKQLCLIHAAQTLWRMCNSSSVHQDLFPIDFFCPSDCLRVLRQMADISLYLAVHVDDVDGCNKSGEIPRRIVGKNLYIGLRVNPEDAIKRVQHISPSFVDNKNIAILQVIFLAKGLLYYVFCRCRTLFRTDFEQKGLL